MPDPSLILQKTKLYFTDMTESMRMIYAEKGAEPFKKPLLLTIPLLLALYLAVYMPLSSKARGIAYQLERLQLISTHYESYQEAKARFTAYQRRIPPVKEKDEWLNHIMTASAKKYGIVFDSLSSQNETEVGNFLAVSRTATATTTYVKVGRWIADMENAPLLAKVTDISIDKDKGLPGTVKVTLTLSTIFPRFNSAETGGTP